MLVADLICVVEFITFKRCYSGDFVFHMQNYGKVQMQFYYCIYRYPHTFIIDAKPQKISLNEITDILTHCRIESV